MTVSKKWSFIVACAFMAAACGGGDTNSGNKTDTTPSNTTTPATASTDSPKGLELIGASDCTTCHRLDKAASGASIGPAYSEVADKYAPAKDTTVDRLVKKIITGGSGVWGTTPMSAHASLPEADVKEMVKYILTLKK